MRGAAARGQLWHGITVRGCRRRRGVVVDDVRRTLITSVRSEYTTMGSAAARVQIRCHGIIISSGNIRRGVGGGGSSHRRRNRSFLDVVEKDSTRFIIIVTSNGGLRNRPSDPIQLHTGLLGSIFEKKSSLINVCTTDDTNGISS